MFMHTSRLIPSSMRDNLLMRDWLSPVPIFILKDGELYG